MEKRLFIFCDGGARDNPGPAAAGFVIKDRQGKILAQAGKFLGQATNNVAEYQGVIEALKWIKDHSQLITCNLQLFLDSKLIVSQLNGLYKIKNANLRLLAVEVKKLEREINGQVSYRLIPREKNYLADRLVNQVLDKLGVNGA